MTNSGIRARFLVNLNAGLEQKFIKRRVSLLLMDGTLNSVQFGSVEFGDAPQLLVVLSSKL